MSAVNGISEGPNVELLSAWFCPYAQRAWIALEEKCEGAFAVTEAMKRKPPATFEKKSMLLEKNPGGQVPVVVDRRGDGEVIVCESLICVEYIDEAMGDGKPTLLPGPPSRRALARMWADKLNNTVCTEFYKLLMGKDHVAVDAAAAKILSCLHEFSQQCKGPFFFGEEFGIVDIALAPWAAGIRMDILKHYRNFEVPRTDGYGKYWEWFAAVSKRPSFIATSTDDIASLIEIYIPYVDGTGYSTVVV